MNKIGHFCANIEELTINNNNFRSVINTNKHMQLVLMVILPNQDIGEEIHSNLDQFFRIEKGKGIGVVYIDDNKKEYNLEDGIIFIVPAGTKHNIINDGTEPLKLYTIYAPPNHPIDRIDINKPINEDEDEINKYENKVLKKKYTKYKGKYLYIKQKLGEFIDNFSKSIDNKYINELTRLL